jgi:hypothetical protein
MTLGYSLFFIILFAYGPGAGQARSQTRFQNLLENKNVLIPQAFEANMPINVKTDHGFITALLQSKMKKPGIRRTVKRCCHKGFPPKYRQ